MVAKLVDRISTKGPDSDADVSGEQHPGAPTLFVVRSGSKLFAVECERMRREIQFRNDMQCLEVSARVCVCLRRFVLIVIKGV